MNWFFFALLTILFYSLFDFFVKLSSDKMHAYWAGFIMNAVSSVVLLLFIVYAKLHGEKVFDVKPNGVLFSTLAGIAVGLVTVFFFKMFASGVNLSLGVPMVRIGIVLLASLLGIFFLRETVNLKYIVGFLISLAGLYLVLTAK